MQIIKYLFIIGIVLFAAILSTVDIGKIGSIILSADPLLISAGLMLVAAEAVIRGLSWKALAGGWSKKYTAQDAIETYLIGQAFGAVTPAKAGDFVKMEDLSARAGLTMTKSFTICLLDRILNFIILFISASASVAVVAMVFVGGASNLLILLVPLAAMVAASAIALNERMSLMLLRPLQAFLVPQRFRHNAKEVFKTFHETVREFIRRPGRWRVLALAVAGWLVIFIRPYFFASAIGIKAEWWAFLIFLPIISVVEVLPISVLGLGTRDATVILLFSLMGADRERMMTLSAMMLVLSLAPQAAAGYLIAWKRKFRRHENPAR
jgi:glycosyltransferase 2 family protein